MISSANKYLGMRSGWEIPSQRAYRSSTVRGHLRSPLEVHWNRASDIAAVRTPYPCCVRPTVFPVVLPHVVHSIVRYSAHTNETPAHPAMQANVSKHYSVGMGCTVHIANPTMMTSVNGPGSAQSLTLNSLSGASPSSGLRY